VKGIGLWEKKGNEMDDKYLKGICKWEKSYGIKMQNELIPFEIQRISCTSYI
jgi:hypothetical protein